MPKKKDRYEFIWSAIQKHGYEYDYRMVNYVNNKTNVKLICKEHGIFEIRPDNHIHGAKCFKCCGKDKKTLEQFIEEAQKLHKNQDGTSKYDYSKVKYVNNSTKVCIICKKHGEFWQTPHSHLSGRGCKKCAIEKSPITQKMSEDEFLRVCKEKHNNFYDYSKVKYDGCGKLIKIICPIHGEFNQKASVHLYGGGCPYCRGLYKTSEFYIKEVSSIHSDINGNPIYDYSKTVYTKAHNNIIVTCKKHGDFKLKAYKHLQGNGCPICKFNNLKSKLEKDIEVLLKNTHIFYTPQKKFDWLKSKQNYLKLDFFLEYYNIAIECQGIQHFKPIEYFGGKEQFKKTVEWDKMKRKLCEENRIKLLYYSNLGIEYPYKVFEDKDELLKEILNTNV